MKLSSAKLRKLIQEELARGVPEYALTRIAEEAADDCSERLLKLLITYANQTSSDVKDRSRKYAAANKVYSSLKRDRDMSKLIEEKLQEKLLEFLDSM